MRTFLSLIALSLVLSACSDSVGPTNPLDTAPTVQLSHVGSGFGDPTTGDLCGGLSPCDAYDYDRDEDGTADGITGAAGFCFQPQVVNSHNDDPACAGDFITDLDGFFQLAYCEVDYDRLPDGSIDGTQPPTIVSCQEQTGWQDLTLDADGGEFYSTSVKFKKQDEGKIYRLYVVRGDQHWAHRDVGVFPSETSPLDAPVLSINTGNLVVKLGIYDVGGSCVYFDTQGGVDENAATCLIAGASSFSFETRDLTVSFAFPAENPTIVADFEMSECLSLGFALDETGARTGNALVDVPLADCKFSVSSDDVDALPNPFEIGLVVTDERFLGTDAPFANARLNLIAHDEQGIGVVPHTVNPGWHGEATSEFALIRWLDRGLETLGSLFGPQPLHAFPSTTFDGTRMTDYHVALAMPYKTFDASMDGTPCADGAPSCLDLGAVPEGESIPVSFHVTAPERIGEDFFDVPGARLHFFTTEGATVACPADPIDLDQVCVWPGDPDETMLSDGSVERSTWPDHLVVRSGSTGRITVDFTPGTGEHRLFGFGCGIASAGPEADPPGEPGADGVWGSLQPTCEDRRAATFDYTLLANGPEDGDRTPFEPVDTENEVAVGGIASVFVVETCPTITVNGTKDGTDGSEWEACAEKTAFSASLPGSKNTENAWLYTWDDGDSLYIGLEVIADDLGSRIFVQIAEEYLSDGVEAPGDDILVIDFDGGGPGTVADWHLTQGCINNNANSLCGNLDALDDDASDPGVFTTLSGAAHVDGAGSGRTFYEFARPLNGVNSSVPDKEDLAAFTGQSLGLKLTVTKGQGGGFGGFTYPDPRGPIEFHPFTIR